MSVTIDGKEGSYEVRNYASTVTLEQDALNAFSILENTHTLDADYIYRDFKELVVELGYYTKEEFKRFIEDAKVYINDSKEPLEEPYLRDEWVEMTGPFEYEIPEDCYLVLGDNRNNSKDSRYWVNSFVTKDEIIGKASFIYFPFNRFGSLN